MTKNWYFITIYHLLQDVGVEDTSMALCELILIPVDLVGLRQASWTRVMLIWGNWPRIPDEGHSTRVWGKGRTDGLI